MACVGLGMKSSHARCARCQLGRVKWTTVAGARDIVLGSGEAGVRLKQGLGKGKQDLRQEGEG
eukprot:1178701-Prorocentrum_minimum.AAC.5